MVAIEAKYHIKGLVGLYNCVRKTDLEGLDDNGQGNAASVSDIVFAELVLYIEETRQGEETAPIFKLSELAQFYKWMEWNRLEKRLIPFFEVLFHI